MKKIFVVSMLSMLMVMPAIADPQDHIVDENTTCTVAGIGVDDGTANVEAIWTPNTIHIDWYNQDTKVLSNDCTYDGDITLPSNPANRAGYTFGGWRIRSVSQQAAQVQCSSITTKSECNATANCGFVDHGFGMFEGSCHDIIEGKRCHTLSQQECNGDFNWGESYRGYCGWDNGECVYYNTTTSGSND